MGSRDLFAKEWDACLIADRDPATDSTYDTSYVDSKRDIGADYEGIKLFTRDFDDSVQLHVEEVEEFCGDANLEDLKSAEGIAGSRRGAWLDDRIFSHGTVGGCVREYSNPLSAASLYDCLKKPRFKHGNSADANRRLIYIPNLDGNYITALAETAAAHQVQALRDAISRHLTLHTSVRVHTRLNVNFTLILHLPHFRLKRYQSPAEFDSQFTSQAEAEKRSPHRDWTKLSFLDSPAANPDETYAMYQARYSLVLCGSGDQRWIGYAFVDRDFDPDVEMDETDFSYTGILEDPIASHENRVIDANRPIKDPREYFLRVLENQSKNVLNEWENLVRLVKRAITRHQKDSQSAGPHQVGTHIPGGRLAFDWNHEVMKLIGKLLNVLCATVKEWEDFRSNNGDHSYFQRTQNGPQWAPRTHEAFREIDETFDRLKSLQSALKSLDNTCTRDANAIQARLIVESNDAVHLTVTVISPVALVIAYFSTSKAVIPFEQNTMTFCLTVVIFTIGFNIMFVARNGRLSQTWASIAANVKAAKLEGFILQNVSYRLTRRWSSPPDLTTRGHELDPVSVV